MNYGSMFQIDCLIAEGQTVHLIPAASEDDVDNTAAVALLAFAFKFRIRILDATFFQGLTHPLRDASGGVNRLYDAPLGYLEVESGTGYIIVTGLGGTLPVLFRPPSLMLV